MEIAANTLKENNINHDILTCNSGDTALNILSENEIDILLLDIIMPGISGIDLLKKIKSNQQYADLQVIMFTSLTDKDSLKKSFEYGATDYVNKPIEPVEFVARINAAIRVREYQLNLNESMAIIKNKNSELQSINETLIKTQNYLIHKEKLISIGELAAGIAHEINNPMGFVSSNFETLGKYTAKVKTLIDKYRELTAMVKENNEDYCLLIKEQLDQLRTLEDKSKIEFILKDTDEIIKDINDGLSRITYIIQSLRRFARQDISDEVTRSDLNEIIDETLLIVRNEIKYNIKIHKNLGNDMIVDCNRSQIGQVVLNIIMNASQAIKNHAVQNGTISIKTYIENNYAICSVSDNGPGIDEKIKNQIFDPFFTTKDVGEGTGLGLSISYDIVVNKHKGELFIQDTPGGGATFIFKLPLNIME